MDILYQGYWALRKKLKIESHSVSKWDTWNNTKFEKKVEKEELSSKDVAELNHKEGLGYEISIFEDINDNFPSNYITIIHKNKHVGVHFIDPGGRKYLTYHFTETKPREQLFLHEIWYYHFTKEDTDQEDYRMHYVFDEEGNVSVRKYDDKNQKMKDYESAKPIDTRGLYESYPEFGKYEGVIKLNRDIPFIEETIKKYFYKDGKRFYKDEDGNLIED